MEVKICSKCKLEKPFDLFFNNKSHKDGKSNYCKECHGADNRNRYHRDKEKASERSKVYYAKNKPMILESSRRYYSENKDKVREKHCEWRKNNRDSVRKIHREWYLKNREKKLKDNRRNEANRLKTDPNFKMRKRLRMYLNRFLIKGLGSKMSEIVGISSKDLRMYFESLFTGDMCWDNYAKLWEIDHIIPCCKFDLTNDEDKRKCFNYKNLRPLLIKDNLKKSGNYEGDIP